PVRDGEECEPDVVQPRPASAIGVKPGGHGRKPGDRVVAMTPGQLAEVMPLAGCDRRKLTGHHDLVARGLRGVETLEEIRRRHPPFTTRAAQYDGALQRERTRRPLRGRIRVGDRTAEGAEVADGPVADLRRGGA